MARTRGSQAVAPPVPRGGTGTKANRRPSWWTTHERAAALVLLLLHFGLALWGAARNSVTFDENFHLPDGVVVVARRDFGISAVNPPMVKAIAACAALAAGARLPDSSAIATRDQWAVGGSFMRRNADHYHRVFFAGRVVVALISVLLGLTVNRFARRLYGVQGGLLALGFYAFSSEALAHAGVVTLDVATGLAITLSLYTFWIFTRTGRWSAWAILALVVGLAAMTRFTTVVLAPIFIVLAVLGTGLQRFHRSGRVWAGIALLAVSTLAVLQVGYLGRTSWRPLAERHFRSAAFRQFQHDVPWLRVPLPDDLVDGIDLQTHEGQGDTPTYFLGKVHTGRVFAYYPLGFAFKWPLGFLAALVVRTGSSIKRRRKRWHETFALLPAAILLLAGMFVLQLNIGIRYLFPIMPLLCVWLGGLAAPGVGALVKSARAARRWAMIGVLLAGLQAIEVMAAAPWYLAFFNRACGGVGGGYRLVNDSNVDWGQGLIALREELERRGIKRIHLAYHGTTDPAIYGIDYIPFLGGTPGPESDWIAISSYYFVGLGQRMTTSKGRSSVPLQFDFGPLRNVKPIATPAGCMYLFRLR